MSKLSVSEFAAKIRTKYPEYKNVADQELAEMFVKKHPVYLESVDMGVPVKKKDQSLAPSSPGAKTASTESPLQSGLKEQPTPSTSELEPAPSLSRAAGLRDVDSRYGPVLSALPEQERTKLETGKGIPKSVTGAERKLNELKAGSYTALGNLLSIQNSAAEQIAMGLKSIGVPEDVASTLESSIKSSGGFYNPYAGELRDVLVKYNTKMAEDIKAKNDAYNMSFDEALERGEIGEALDIATGSFVESLPQMAAIVAAGATTGPLGAGVYGQVSSFDSYKRQLMRDYGIDEDQAKKIAFGLATVEGAMDGVTGGMAKFGAKAIKDLGKEAGEKAIKGFAQKVISNPAAVFLGGSLGEAGTEAATQLGQNAILKATVDPELDLMNGVKLAGAAGLIGGGTFSTPVVIASTVGKVSDIKKRNEVNKKIDELSIALDNGEIPSYMTEEVKAQRDALVAEKRKMFTDDLEFYNSMSEDDRNKVTDINTKIKSLSDDIKSGKVTRDSFEAVRDVAKNLIVEKQNIEQKYVSQEGKQVPGTEQGGEAVVQAEPVEGAGKKETPSGRVLQAPEKTVGTVRGLLNRRATFSDPVSETIVEGDVYQDGQRVVIETEEGKIFDIGNIDEIQDRPTSELGLSEAKGRISVNEDGSFTYNGGDNQKIQGGTVMVNRQTGLKSIKRGKDGSIKTVSLTSPDGTETYNLKGQDAVDAAYQIMLNFSTSPEQSARVEQMLQQNEKARTEIESAGRILAGEVTEPTNQEAVRDTVRAAEGRDGGRAVEATTQEIANRFTSQPEKSKLYNAVRKASKTLKSIIPDATYVFVDSDADAADYYKANMADVDTKENGSDKGRVFQNKNTGKVEIVINTSKADDVTAYHELFHAAFFRVYAQDAKTAIDFSNRLAKTLDSGTAAEKAIAKRVKDHVSKYEGDTEAVVSEEFLAELAGIMTSDAKSITQGMASKLANFFNRIAKAMGIGPVFKKAATTKEVVDFMNSFAKAARQGAAFEPKNKTVGRNLKTASSKETKQDGKETKRPAAGNRLFNEPLTEVKSIADKYFKGAFGTERPTFEGTRTLDKERAKRISDAFDAMKHSPNDPEVAAAYEALSKETVDQYNAFLDAGYTVEINNEEPYANSQEMIDDLRNNKRIKIFSTESGFGETPITAKQRKENPLLATTKFKDVNGEPMLINDLFRAVHDFYGHAELGNSFGPLGEENAWNVHSRMFSPLARRAMTSETRGQNSYVNFSGVNEKADKLREKARKLREDGKIEEAIKVAEEIYGITSFADQKIGLLPEEFSQIDDFEARSSKFDDSKRSFSKAELDELPNSKYTKEQIESMINSGTYSLMSAENPQAVNTAEDNDERTARAEKWLKKNGYGDYTKIYGVFGSKENSFFVPDMTMEDAEAFRKEFDQESVAHSDGYISKKGVNPRDREGNKFGIDYKDPESNNYSIIKDSEGNVISFSTDYNFKKTEDLKKEVSSRSKINLQQIKDDVDEAVLWFRTKFQDKLARVLKTQEDIEAYVGGGVDLKYDFKNAEARLSSVVETAGNKTLAKAEEVVKLFKSAGLNVEEFNDLLYAMHALERNARKRIQTTDISSSLSDLRGVFNMTPTEVANAAGLDVDTYRQIESTGNITETELNSILDVYGMTEGEFYNTYAANKSGSGMTDVDAIDILFEYPGINPNNPLPSQLKGDLRKAVEMVYEINKETREILVSTGLEPKDKVENFEMSYNNYVPLIGFAEDPEENSFIEGGTRLSVVGRTKKALGRYSKADSPFTQSIVQNVAAITRGNKNLAVQKLYNLLDDNKNDNLYKVIDPAVNPKYKNVEKNGKIVRVPMAESDYLSKPKEYVPVRFDGKYRFISFADERLNTAVNGMNNQEIGVITGALKTVNGWMSAFITRYDPEFVFRNFARDIQSAVFNAMAEQELTDGLANGEKIVSNVMKGVYPSFKVIVQNNRGGKPTGEYANYYNEFLEYGGQIGGFFGQGSKAVDEKVVDFFNKASKNNGNGIADMPVDAVKYLGKSIDDVNNAVENAVRLSAFIAARKAKISPEKAAELSKGLTVNFNKSGEYGQVGNAALLFFNASIQGSMRIFRTLKPNYVETATGKKLKVTNAQKFALGLVGLGAIIALFNAASSGDDEEDGKSWYSKIPDYEKERNLIIMNPFDKKGKDYFKIPLPYGYNLFYILGNTIADINLGVSTTSEGISNILMSIVTNFSPTGIPGGKDLNEKILNFLTPSVLRPITEISINKDFLGRPIYTEQLDFTKGPIPDSESGKKAGAVATNLAKLMNQTTGGTEFTPGKIDVNPDVLEYIFGYYSGGTGKTLTRSSKLIEKGINGELSEVKPNEIPLARVFYGSSFEGADYSQYWDRLNTIYRLRKDAEAGNITPAEAKRVDVTFRKLKETESVLRNIRKVEKALDENKSTDKDRYKELDKKKGEYIKGFFSIYDKNNIDDI